MTKKLEQLYSSDARSKTIGSIRRSFCDFIGPLSAREIWEKFSDPKFENFRDNLSIRGPTLQMFVEVNQLFINQPTSPVTDAILRLVQEHTEAEIYPGSFEDLGIRK